jgi:hypothetical protein
MNKSWKIIKNIKFESLNECLKELKKKKINVSIWIEDIIKLNKYNYSNINFPIKLVRKFVKDFGFKGPTELNKIYSKAKKLGLNLVPPEIAIYARLIYNEQPNGEWLRFATPFNSMVDSDGVPHLPKLGKSLGFFFIETYWSYPKAIFHPHNDFVFLLK